MGTPSCWQPQSPGRRAQGQQGDPATLAQRTRPALGQLERGTLPWGLLGDVVPSQAPHPMGLSTPALLPWAAEPAEGGGLGLGERRGHPLSLATACERQRLWLLGILSGMGLAGGGGGGRAVPQFLGGVPRTAEGGWPLPWSTGVLGEENVGERSETPQEGGRPIPALPGEARSAPLSSLVGAEEDTSAQKPGGWKVSAPSSRAPLGFCLSVQLPSFRVLLTPPPSSSSCLPAAWGVCLCLCLGDGCCQRKSVALGKGLPGPLALSPSLPGSADPSPRRAACTLYLLQPCDQPRAALSKRDLWGRQAGFHCLLLPSP